jgi:hypothetical protein
MGCIWRSRNFTAVPWADQIKDAIASNAKYHSIRPL